MRKTFYSLLLALIAGVFTAKAQITQADMPAIGSTYEYKVDTNSTTYFSPGSAGSGQTWNFSFTAANADSTLIEKYLDPANTPYANDFSTATIAVQLNNVNAYGYARASSSMIEDLGMAGDFVAGAPTLPPTSFMPDGLMRMTFPANVGTSFSDHGYVSITWQNISVGSPLDPLDELTVNLHIWKTVDVDGSGDLTINGQTWTNVIRYRIKEETKDSVWVTKAPLVNNMLYRNTHDSTVTYRWYSKTLRNDVLRVTYDGTEQNVQSIEYTTATPTTGIISLSEAGIIVYPNPAKDFLNITDSKKIIRNVSVKNLLGQNMEATYSNGQVNVENLPSGMYILEINDLNGNKITSKFIKE